jgi:uncharacterized protein YjeT (DUF2065 family)
MLIIGGVLCLEGVLPLLVPAVWKRIMDSALLGTGPQLRLVGGVLSVGGCVLMLMASHALVSVAGALLLVEGVPLLLSPAMWSGVMRGALALREGQLRFLGLLGFGAGALLVLLSGVV